MATVRTGRACATLFRAAVGRRTICRSLSIGAGGVASLSRADVASVFVDMLELTSDESTWKKWSAFREKEFRLGWMAGFLSRLGTGGLVRGRAGAAMLVRFGRGWDGVEGRRVIRA